MSNKKRIRKSKVKKERIWAKERSQQSKTKWVESKGVRDGKGEPEETSRVFILKTILGFFLEELHNFILIVCFSIWAVINFFNYSRDKTKHGA